MTAIHTSPFMKKNMKPRNPSRFSQPLNLLLVINRFIMISFLEKNSDLVVHNDIKTPLYSEKYKIFRQAQNLILVAQSTVRLSW